MCQGTEELTVEMGPKAYIGVFQAEKTSLGKRHSRYKKKLEQRSEA